MKRGKARESLKMVSDGPLDRLTAAAAALLDAPVATIVMNDAGAMALRAGVNCCTDQIPREQSFTAHALEFGPGGLMVVEDASADPRFRDSALVSGEAHIRFYAGAVITTADGQDVGALCVLDIRARETPDPVKLEALRALARTAADILDGEAQVRAQGAELEMLNLAGAMSGVGHWRCDAASGQVVWSDEVYRVHGVTRETFDPSRDDAIALFHPEDQAELRHKAARLVEAGEPMDYELRLLTPEGQERIVRGRASADQDETGRLRTVVGVVHDVTDEITALRQAQRNEARYRLLADNSADVIARVKPDGSSPYISPSIEQLLGWRYEEMSGQSTDYVHPDDRADVLAVIAAVLKGSPKRAIQHRAVHRDGRIIWVESRFSAIARDDGKPMEVIVAIRDASERKALEDQVQAALQESRHNEERYRMLADRAEDIIITYGYDTIVTYASPSLERITGIKPEDMVGTTVNRLLHPEDWKSVNIKLAEFIRDHPDQDMTTQRYRAFVKSGEVRDYETRTRIVRDDEGRVREIQDVARDVTETRRLEERLQAALDVAQSSEERYRAIADRTHDVIVTYTLNSLVTYASPALERIAGIRPEDMIGTSVNRLVHPEDIAATVNSLMTFIREHPTEEFTTLRYRGIDKDGAIRFYETRTRVVRDDAGQVVEIQDVSRDVTETRRLEEELREARDRAEAAAQAKGEFLANMSHELRTPLTSVVGFAGLLKQSQSLSAEDRRHVERITTGSEALLSVINDILDYSKLEAEALAMDPTAFNLWDFAHGAGDLMEAQRAAKALDLSVVIDAEAPEALVGDEGRLRQVTLNFLSNAMKFTTDGSVRLDVGGQSTGEGGWRLRVAVTDTGIGIAPDKLGDLFERFTQADQSTTRNFGGTGLGLAISKRLVEAMGGEIGVDSAPGEGSTFWFEVPLAVADGAGPARVQEAPAPDRSARILVADDAAANRELVSAILRQLGVQADTVCDGAEAVEAVSTGFYDLVLMDMHMPVMDGLEAVRRIRALDGDIARTPVIALTANVQVEQIQRCLEAGMDGHLGKPIDVAELARTVNLWLSRAAESPGASAVA